MPDWGWTLVGAAGGAVIALAGGYAALVWYFSRNNPM